MTTTPLFHRYHADPGSDTIVVKVRSRAQQYWDRFALLHLFDCVEQERSNVDGNVKAQKLAFLVEKRATEQRLAVLHHRFFRYQAGPFSAELANDIRDMELAGLVTKSTRTLTKRGRFLHDYIAAVVREMRAVASMVAIETIEGVARDYGRKSGIALKTTVYGMEVPVYDFGNEPAKVRNIPMFLDIFNPVHDTGLTDIEELPPDVVRDIDEELAIPSERLDPEHASSRHTVRRALEQALK